MSSPRFTQKGKMLLVAVGIIIVLGMFGYKIGYNEGKDLAIRDNRLILVQE